MVDSDLIKASYAECDALSIFPYGFLFYRSYALTAKLQYEFKMTQPKAKGSKP